MAKVSLNTDEILTPWFKRNPIYEYMEGAIDAGDLAKIAKAMELAAKDIQDQLRSDVEFPANEESVVISGVEFKKRKGYSYRSLDSTVVKKLYPYKDYPAYYAENETVVAPTIAISIKE